MTSSERSVVLGVCTNLSARRIEPFARSLRDVGFRGRFVVFSGRTSEADKELLRTMADVVVDADPDYPPPAAPVLRLLRFLRSTRRLRRLYPSAFAALARAGRPQDSLSRWSRLEFHLEGLQSLRYHRYRDYLETLEPEPDAVLLTDLRDVYFQRDPFAEPVDELEVYLEDESIRIGEEAFNTRWIRDLYGGAEVERLRGSLVSCSGTVVGTRDGVVAYLDEMSREIVRYRRPMGSHDQGVHNVLLRSGRLPRATVAPNGHGRVLTVGAMAAYERAADGTVLNADGSVPAILHQWDRHAELVAWVEGTE